MDENNISFEPMDVDLSAHSSNDMDISFNESKNGIDAFSRKHNDSGMSTPTPVSFSEKTGIDAFIRKINDSFIMPTTMPPRDEIFETLPSASSDHRIPVCTTNVKKIHISIKRDTESCHNKTMIKVVCAALVLFLSTIAFQVLSIQCSDGIVPDKLRDSLSNKLYGQSKAIDALVEGLTVYEGSKVLVLYGSTGVGKTFAASILLDQVGPYSNVYHYTMPSFMETFTTDFMIGLTVCKETIIIIDDLSSNDLEVKVHIQNLLSKCKNLDKVVSVLLIYNNCNTTKDFRRQCDESFPDKIMDNLKQVKAYKKIIRFESLTKEHLRKCIETELKPKKITDEELTKVLKNFDVTVDGCKGVHMKMKLLDIS